MKWVWTLGWTLVFFVYGVAITLASIDFERFCEGYLKRAADANTIEMAAQELEVAIKYAEANNLTTGYTSIVYQDPSEDIGFWYKNLTASLDELRAVSPEASQLEKTNVLMKLRETLMDQGTSSRVTVPAGLEVYPSNFAYAFWGWLSSVMALAGWLYLLKVYLP